VDGVAVDGDRAPMRTERNHTVSDSRLFSMIKAEVEAAVQRQFKEPLGKEFSELLGKHIDKAITDYRKFSGDSAGYESALGSFLVEQIPYASWENLDLPNIPLDPNGENTWVRRSGVLSEYNAQKPLPAEQPIPGGIVVNFSYADWKYLREPDDPEDSGDYEVVSRSDLAPKPEAAMMSRAPVAPEASSKEVVPDAFIKPPAFEEKPDGAIPPNKTKYYPHNIVKTVRLRYTILDRRYSKKDANLAGKNRDRQRGYILIQYSGSDN
jgi:hypothetical protein